VGEVGFLTARSWKRGGESFSFLLELNSNSTWGHGKLSGSYSSSFNKLEREVSKTRKVRKTLLLCRLLLASNKGGGERSKIIVGSPPFSCRAAAAN